MTDAQGIACLFIIVSGGVSGSCIWTCWSSVATKLELSLSSRVAGYVGAMIVGYLLSTAALAAIFASL